MPTVVELVKAAVESSRANGRTSTLEWSNAAELELMRLCVDSSDGEYIGIDWRVRLQPRIATLLLELLEDCPASGGVAAAIRADSMRAHTPLQTAEALDVIEFMVNQALDSILKNPHCELARRAIEGAICSVRGGGSYASVAATEAVLLELKEMAPLSMYGLAVRWAVTTAQRAAAAVPKIHAPVGAGARDPEHAVEVYWALRQTVRNSVIAIVLDQLDHLGLAPGIAAAAAEAAGEAAAAMTADAVGAHVLRMSGE